MLESDQTLINDFGWPTSMGGDGISWYYQDANLSNLKSETTQIGTLNLFNFLTFNF